MPMRWLTWSWIPGLHGITWLYAGRLAKVLSYMVFGLFYSLCHGEAPSMLQGRLE